jgi:hypothetical protein
MPRATPEPAPQQSQSQSPHRSQSQWTFKRWQLSMRWQLSQRERQTRRSSQRSSQRRTRKGSCLEPPIYYTSRTPSWTYDLRSGTYDLSSQICRGMLVRTGSRSSRCSEPSWTDYHQPQDLLHHHQPRDVFVTSWFIFTPLTLHFLFSVSALWTVLILSLGVFLSLCAHCVFNYAFYFSYGLFSLVCLI